MHISTHKNVCLDNADFTKMIRGVQNRSLQENELHCLEINNNIWGKSLPLFKEQIKWFNLDTETPAAVFLSQHASELPRQFY